MMSENFQSGNCKNINQHKTKLENNKSNLKINNDMREFSKRHLYENTSKQRNQQPIRPKQKTNNDKREFFQGPTWVKKK